MATERGSGTSNPWAWGVGFEANRSETAFLFGGELGSFGDGFGLIWWRSRQGRWCRGRKDVAPGHVQRTFRKAARAGYK